MKKNNNDEFIKYMNLHTYIYKLTTWKKTRITTTHLSTSI
jgi:hypothetical protein